MEHVGGELLGHAMQPELLNLIVGIAQSPRKSLAAFLQAEARIWRRLFGFSDAASTTFLAEMCLYIFVS